MRKDLKTGLGVHCETCQSKACREMGPSLRQDLLALLEEMTPTYALWWSCHSASHCIQQGGTEFPDIAWPALIPPEFSLRQIGPGWLAVPRAAEVTAVHLERLRHRLTLALEEMGGPESSHCEVVWCLTGDLQRILFCTTNVTELFGSELERIYREPTCILESVHPDDRPHFLQSLKDFSVQHHPTRAIRYRNVHPNGDLLHISTRVQRLGKGQDSLLIGYCYEIPGEDIPGGTPVPQGLTHFLSHLEERLGLKLATAVQDEQGLNWLYPPCREETSRETGPVAEDLPERVGRHLKDTPRIFSVDLEKCRIWVAIAGEGLPLAMLDWIGPAVSKTVALEWRAQAQSPKLRPPQQRQRNFQLKDFARHLAREIHDEIGQTLTAIKLQLRWAQDELGAHRELGTVEQLVNQALTATRHMAVELRANPPLTADLWTSFRSYAEVMEQLTGLKVEFRGNAGGKAQAPVHLSLLRIFQEALTNAIRHSQTRSVVVTINEDAEALHLCVSDAGVGCDQPQGGLGLLGIKERVEQLGGTLAVETAPGQGFTLRVSLPRGEPDC